MENSQQCFEGKILNLDPNDKGLKMCVQEPRSYVMFAKDCYS